MTEHLCADCGENITKEIEATGTHDCEFAKYHYECTVCFKILPYTDGYYNYPTGLHCLECGEKSIWYEKFKNMRASEVIKYLGIDPKQYGLTQEQLDELIERGKENGEKNLFDGESKHD